MTAHEAFDAVHPTEIADERLREVLDLVERSTALEHGLAFVRRAPVESVAITLGVHPRVVEHACDCLDRVEERAMMIRFFARARARRRTLPPKAVVHAPVATPRTAEQLIDEATRSAKGRGHSLGVQFLLCAPLETAAILFRAHPDLVLRARELLAARGVVAEE